MKNYETCVDLLILHSKIIFKKLKHHFIVPLRPTAAFYNQFVVVTVLGVITAIHHHPKTFSVFDLDYVKSECLSLKLFTNCKLSSCKYLRLKLGYYIIFLFECVYIYGYMVCIYIHACH